MMTTSGITIVVPFFNEQETIPNFCSRMDEYAKGLEFGLEIIFVNDCSKDNSLDLVKEFQFKYVNRVRIICLSKNYGSHIAIRAGIKNATYDMCTWIGMDLQEPLDIIPIAFVKLTKEAKDAVYFEKRTVKVSGFNRLFSRTYSYLMRKYAVSSYSTVGTATIAFGKKIKEYLNSNMEPNSSLMLQIMDSGFDYDTVPLDYNERIAGKSKWTMKKKIKLFIDSFVSFSFMPIRLVSIVGIVIFLLGIIIGISTIINRLVNPEVPMGYSTISSILALGFGVTNISLGIIAEYLWRTFDVARNRPLYLVSDMFDVKK